MAEARDALEQGMGLPWRSAKGEHTRFALTAALVAIVFLPLAVLIPILDVPEIERSQAEKVPPQLARLVERPEPVKLPDPVRPEPEPEPQIEPEIEPEPKKTAEQRHDPPAPEVAQPAPDPVQPRPTQQSVEQAREKASRSGLLAMKDRLASLREVDDVVTERMHANASADGPLSGTEAAGAGDVLKGSGGVEDAAAPDATVAVQGHRVKKVEVAPEPAVQEVTKTVPAKPTTGERAMSNIRKVFDAQKTALYSLYRRELRQDPTLEGKVLLELVIEPDGSVSACQVVSSELENPSLEQRIAMRVRLFNFGPDNVETRKVRFPIDFLPG
ncbi:AgmX/PglI C-terminal domain-containing protein [Marinobacter sp. F4206]|uniref:AgmX/PglI C-terminal domain-containing protein n=1 Tax=Marinobacter sp. F4206 TaxID=2861777 RepID=UPI001C5DEF98|nr:AgmX/PglI C-terminal domain-containing protein [Marinobacter sp. F4206]MBW4933360.1 AgmX/PglI C-terminal domain-containing protein [Marinobacter sp. F4206]